MGSIGRNSANLDSNFQAFTKCSQSINQYPKIMEIKSILPDSKVAADSILIEISIREYLKLAKEIFKTNSFQRKRVRNSRTVYSLLKADLLAGCVMPPIVLAYTQPTGTLQRDPMEAFVRYSSHFVLLDGLQRSHTLMDIEAETALQPEIQDNFLNRKIRCEIYEGINRLGILYRMLTLNTGQTAMSLRHQIEIMYLDLLDNDYDGVTLVREADGSRARNTREYNFRDMIEGLNSYIERSESPLDRGDVLDNISSLENLAKENDNHDLFRDFVKIWDEYINKMHSLDLSLATEESQGDTWSTDSEDESKPRRVWASTGLQAFKRAQAISGFGAAIGMLKDEGENIDFRNLPINEITIGCEKDEFLPALNTSIQGINQSAKKIGNAQRLFFRQFFKMLFWKDSGCYLNLYLAQVEAFKGAKRIGI